MVLQTNSPIPIIEASNLEYGKNDYQCEQDG